MGATENRCVNILILLALQALIRLSRFWASNGSDFRRRYIPSLFQSVIELRHRLAKSILRTYQAGRYCAAVPNFTMPHNYRSSPATIEDGDYRNVADRGKVAPGFAVAQIDRASIEDSAEMAQKNPQTAEIANHASQRVEHQSVRFCRRKRRST
jgi:hypothetical protein